MSLRSKHPDLDFLDVIDTTDISLARDDTCPICRDYILEGEYMILHSGKNGCDIGCHEQCFELWMRSNFPSETITDIGSDSQDDTEDQVEDLFSGARVLRCPTCRGTMATPSKFGRYNATEFKLRCYKYESTLWRSIFPILMATLHGEFVQHDALIKHAYPDWNQIASEYHHRGDRYTKLGIRSTHFSDISCAVMNTFRRQILPAAQAKIKAAHEAIYAKAIAKIKAGEIAHTVAEWFDSSIQTAMKLHLERLQHDIKRINDNIISPSVMLANTNAQLQISHGEQELGKIFLEMGKAYACAANEAFKTIQIETNDTELFLVDLSCPYC